MKVYVALGDEGSILEIFSSRESAEASFPDHSIEEHELCDAVLPPWTYLIRGASVYPDGTYEQWRREGTGGGYSCMEACDDHLNAGAEPWDGHTQGHCGEHISISGTDRELVEATFQKHLTAAIARQNGKCQSKFHNHRRVDGKSVYEAGWSDAFRYSRVGG
jgi:hypothetical protein